MTRPGTSLARLTDMGNKVDEWARDDTEWQFDAEMADAIRHAVEGFTRVAQAYPQTADAIEVFVTRMAEALGVEP